MARLFQFSVRGMLWAVTILAIGIAALLNANGIWLGLTWALALYALTAAGFLFIYRRGEQRAFWLGFAVFGALYLLLFLVSQQSWFYVGPLAQNDLLATRLAYWSHGTLLPESRRTEYIQVQAPADPFGPNDPVGMGSSMPGGNMLGGGSMPGAMGPGMGAMMSSAGGGPTSGTIPMPNPNFVPLQTYTYIFHALGLLLIAAVGGKTCQVIYRTRPATEQ